MLVFQNNRMAAMLKSQTNPVGVEFFRFVNALPCNQYAHQIAMWVKTKRFIWNVKFKLKLYSFKFKVKLYIVCRICEDAFW